MNAILSSARYAADGIVHRVFVYRSTDCSQSVVGFCKLYHQMRSPTIVKFLPTLASVICRNFMARYVIWDDAMPSFVQGAIFHWVTAITFQLIGPKGLLSGGLLDKPFSNAPSPLLPSTCLCFHSAQGSALTPTSLPPPCKYATGAPTALDRVRK